MKEQQIDELFIGKLANDQSFHQREQQWKVVKAAIPNGRKRYLLWVLIPFLIIGTSALTALYLGSDTQQPFAQNTSDKNLFSATEGTSVPKVIEAASPTELKIPVDKFSVTAISNSIEERVGTLTNTLSKDSSVSQLPTISQSSANNKLENQSLYIDINPHRKATSSKIVSIEAINQRQYLNSSEDNYGSKSSNYYPGLQEQFINHNYINQLDIVAVTTDAESLLLERIEVPQYDKQLISRKKFMAFVGPSYSFTQNPDLQLNKPAAFKMGIAYSPIKLLTLRMAYQYDPFDMQVNSNFERYNIEPQGSYEPQFREKLNVRGQSHVMSLGLATNIRAGKWGIYPMINANIQYLTKAVEESTFITNYERVVTVDDIVNQSSLSTFSGGFGLQYNLRHTAISLEYEYYMPFNSLYEWTGVQTICFLVQYKF